jgi:hypothetical protein
MIALRHSSTSQQSPITPEFGTTADGFPVARIGETLLALLSTRDGSFFLASAWRNFKPLEELRRDHFYGHDGRVENEAAFRDRVFETSGHMSELAGLARVQTQIAASTPWGGSQFATVYADGVIKHSTAGHGGFHLSSDRNRQVDSTLRTEGGWYEEDAEWAVVAATFPALFTTYERRCADETIQNSWPEFWEQIHGRTLGPGESLAKDRSEFDRLHAGDWVVISAIQSRHHAGMTEVIATIGGCREHRRDERRFLIPQAEYAARSHLGFVIDLEPHAVHDGASSLIGRQAKVA